MKIVYILLIISVLHFSEAQNNSPRNFVDEFQSENVDIWTTNDEIQSTTAYSDDQAHETKYFESEEHNNSPMNYDEEFQHKNDIWAMENEKHDLSPYSNDQIDETNTAEPVTHHSEEQSEPPAHVFDEFQNENIDISAMKDEYYHIADHSDVRKNIESEKENDFQKNFPDEFQSKNYIWDMGDEKHSIAEYSDNQIYETTNFDSDLERQYDSSTNFEDQFQTENVNMWETNDEKQSIAADDTNNFESDFLHQRIIEESQNQEYKNIISSEEQMPDKLPRQANNGKYHRNMTSAELVKFSYFQELEDRHAQLFSRQRYENYLAQGRISNSIAKQISNSSLQVFKVLKSVLKMIWQVLKRLLQKTIYYLTTFTMYTWNLWKTLIGIPIKMLRHIDSRIVQMVKQTYGIDILPAMEEDTTKVIFRRNEDHKVDVVPPHPEGWETMISESDLKPSLGCGYPANAASWKFLVSLHYHKNDNPTMLFCVGSLIHSKWVLTAGHCIKPYIHPVFRWLYGMPTKNFTSIRFTRPPPIYVLVRIGCYNQINVRDGRYVKSSKWYVYPGYGGAEKYKAGEKFTYLAANDVGLYHLDSPVLNPIIGLGSGFPRLGRQDFCKAAGWGVHYTIFYTEDHASECADQAYHYPLRGLLYEHKMSIMSTYDCNKFIQGIKERQDMKSSNLVKRSAQNWYASSGGNTTSGSNPAMLFCSQPVPEISANYRIDMGSPLVCNNRIMAIASIVDEFVIWMQVGHYVEWIKATMNESGDKPQGWSMVAQNPSLDYFIEPKETIERKRIVSLADKCYYRFTVYCFSLLILFMMPK